MNGTESKHTNTSAQNVVSLSSVLKDVKEELRAGVCRAISWQSLVRAVLLAFLIVTGAPVLLATLWLVTRKVL